jgi:hypothetical protein
VEEAVKELSPQGRHMVRALRSEQLSAEDRARLRARVLRTAAAASVAAAATVTTAKASGSALSGAAATQASAVSVAAASAPLAKAAGVGLMWKLGVASALMVASVPATQTLLTTHDAKPRVAEHAARAHHAPVKRVAQHVPVAEPAPVVSPLPVSTPEPLVPAPALAVVEPAFEPAPLPAARPKKPAVAQASSLVAESALLEQALQAARDGDPVRARRVLALHALSYPDGLLAPERERVRARLEAESTAPSP